MSLIYITGVAGTGKSTILAELKKRGYEAYGTDEDGLAGNFNIATGRRVENEEIPKKPSVSWRQHNPWIMPVDKVKPLIQVASSKTIFLCGGVANQDQIINLVDMVIGLEIDEVTLKDRIANRTNSNFGKQPTELNDILKWRNDYSESFRNYRIPTLDATQPLNKVVDDILNFTEARKA